MQSNILIIDNNDSFTWNLVQIIEEHGGYRISVENNPTLSTNSHCKYHKILFSPGPGLPSDFPIMEKFIRNLTGKVPILGICLGHQSIACTFGSTLINLPQISHGLKKKITIIDKSDYLFQNIPTSTEVGLYHSWAVSRNNFPDCLKITALTDDGIIMGIAHKKFDIKGIQFHPESIMTDYGRLILNNWLNH